MIRDKPVPPRVPDSAFDNFDELRTIDEMNDILADRHRVKMNSLMSKLKLNCCGLLKICHFLERILMKHIDMQDVLDSKLQTYFHFH